MMFHCCRTQTLAPRMSSPTPALVSHPQRTTVKRRRLVHGSSQSRSLSQPVGVQNSGDYCMDLVKRSDYTSYLCTLLLGSKHRKSAFAVRAINVEIAKIRDSAKEEIAGQMRFQFWKDAIDMIYSGKAPNHPVTMALIEAVDRHNLPQGLFYEMLNARVADQAQSGFKTMEDLEDYADKTTTSVLMLLMQILGCRTEEADLAACHIGRAVGLCAVLQGAPSMLQRREVRFPKDLLDEQGFKLSMLEKAHECPQLVEVAFSIASVANSHVETARKISSLSGQAKQVLLPAIVCSRYLEGLQQADFNLFDPRLQKRDGLLPAKLWYTRHWSRSF